jgi:uncharacterized spore protein YtfJ
MAEIFKTIVEPLQSTAAVKSVFGDPVSAQGKTVIPVARIAWGFGGGWGKREREGKPAEDGEGGGGGVVATPLGVFEVTDSETRFIPLNENRKFVAGGFAGLVIGFLWATRRQAKRKERNHVRS